MNREETRDYLLLHSRSNLNGLFPEHSDFIGKITNPMCGDHVELRIHSIGEMIYDIGFKTSSCAICSASASLVTQEIKGKTILIALEWSGLFESSLIESKNISWPEEIAAFSCFEHLRINPSRIVCALLPWTAMRSAFKNIY